MFVIFDFLYSDGKFDSDTYKNFYRWNHFVYQKIFCGPFWRFLLVILFCCSVFCVFTSCDLDCKKVIPKTFFVFGYFLRSSFVYNFLEIANSFLRCA